MPEYVIEATGPDHMKSFTAQVRVADRLYGHGVGRSKKEAEQQAAETAYREIDEAARLEALPVTVPDTGQPPAEPDDRVTGSDD